MTKAQFEFLYKCHQEKIGRDFEFQAALHGVSLKGGSKKSKKETQSANQPVPLFGDPEEYKKLSSEEKESLTQKMLNKHKTWAENPFSKGI